MPCWTCTSSLVPTVCASLTCASPAPSVQSRSSTTSGGRRPAHNPWLDYSGQPQSEDGHAPHHGATAPDTRNPSGARAGISTLRGAFHPQAGIAEEVARKIEHEPTGYGLLDEPVGVDVRGIDASSSPILFALQAAGVKVVDGQQLFLEARRIKTRDEISLLTQAASMVDAAYDRLYEFLRPGVRENGASASSARSSTTWGPSTSRASTPSLVNGAHRIPTCTPTASCARGILRSSTSSTATWATAPATTAPSPSEVPRWPSESVHPLPGVHGPRHLAGAPRRNHRRHRALMGPPRRWQRPTPSVTNTVWLKGWRCQWVRAPGMKCTRFAVSRDGGGAAATESM